MGAWSLSITGNDTAQDLINDYQAAFYYNDIDTALIKIDAYVRTLFDESDSNEWCDYFYSLADYMWRKGILTDQIRDEALRLIDSGFGLEIYEEAGMKTLKKRMHVLQVFREKITSKQPPSKKITVDLYTKPIFENGDIITIQLKTSDKFFTGHCKISEKHFRELDGKLVALRKIANRVSYVSSVEPAVSDIWPVFQLYDKVFDEVPELKDVIELKYANTEHGSDGLFYCEGSMFHFKQRKYVILGNCQTGIKSLDFKPGNAIYFGINKPWVNADEKIINAITFQKGWD